MRRPATDGFKDWLEHCDRMRAEDAERAHVKRGGNLDVDWRPHLGERSSEYLKYQTAEADRLRQERVLDWVRKRGTWMWPDTPKAWLDTMTVDLVHLEHAGQIEVLTRPATTERYTTTEYRLADHCEQLTLV